MFLKIEAGLSVLALVLALRSQTSVRAGLKPSSGASASWRGGAGFRWSWWDSRRLALRLALLPILPVPTPAAMDEFSYLLIADTFAHGRLANPTSPMWAHLESPLVLWHPTHVGIYHPAQGLFMAVGQVLLGHPYWGVWLSVGIMCAAICWMLQAWVGESWAIAGRFSGRDSVGHVQLLG